MNIGFNFYIVITFVIILQRRFSATLKNKKYVIFHNISRIKSKYYENKVETLWE